MEKVIKFFCNVNIIAAIMASKSIKPAIRKWNKKSEKSVKPNILTFEKEYARLKKSNFNIDTFANSFKKIVDVLFKLYIASN